MILLRLYFEFFKTGLFAVGGGLATIPFLRDISAATGWFTDTDLTTMIAVSESTPGPIGVNMATYVGFQTAGVPGSVIATLGLITPSIIIILNAYAEFGVYVPYISNTEVPSLTTDLLRGVDDVKFHTDEVWDTLFLM